MLSTILKVEKRTTKDTKKEFPVYATTNKNGEIIKVKFRQEVKNAPTEPGTYTMYFNSENANMTRDFYGKVMWVNKAEFGPVVRKDTVSAEFEEVDPENLPF